MEEDRKTLEDNLGCFVAWHSAIYSLAQIQNMTSTMRTKGQQ